MPYIGETFDRISQLWGSIITTNKIQECEMVSQRSQWGSYQEVPATTFKANHQEDPWQTKGSLPPDRTWSFCMSEMDMWEILKFSHLEKRHREHRRKDVSIMMTSGMDRKCPLGGSKTGRQQGKPQLEWHNSLKRRCFRHYKIEWFGITSPLNKAS